MAVLDQERGNLIKQMLKWHPRGMTISNLTTKMKLNRNLVAKYLDMLLISGQVEMMTVGVAKVFFLSQRVPVSAMLEFVYQWYRPGHYRFCDSQGTFTFSLKGSVLLCS
jgi:predicted transcriptional regulator